MKQNKETLFKAYLKQILSHKEQVNKNVNVLI